MNKTAIVTGGNKGIGLDIVETLVESDYYVIVGARTDVGLNERFNEKVDFIQIDVKSEISHKKLVELALDKSGRLDLYVNNAGYSEWRPIQDINEEFLVDIIQTNLIGYFWGCKAAADKIVNGGSIINISSIAGKRGSSNNSAYCATKFGVNGLTQSLSKELGPKNIRVNAICPVIIATEGLIDALSEKDSPAAGNPKQFIENFKDANAALNKLPTGRDIGQMVLFLASDSASSITGQCINVDCGVFPQ